MKNDEFCAYLGVEADDNVQDNMDDMDDFEDEETWIDDDEDFDDLPDDGGDDQC